jgi:hypothetical protein
MAMFAGGLHHGFEIAVLVVAAGTADAIVPFVPGGLGVVEAIIPAVLAWYSTPVSQGFAVAVVYLTVGTFLPAAGGAVALPFVPRRRRRRGPPPRPKGNPSRAESRDAAHVLPSGPDENPAVGAGRLLSWAGTRARCCLA